MQFGKESQNFNLGKDFEIFLNLVQKELPKNLGIENFIYKIVKLYKDLKTALQNPLNTVVIQEAEKYNKLINLI